MSKYPYVVIAFHEWMIKENWKKHSSGEYYYRNGPRNDNQWPPKETATEEELLAEFFG